MAKYWNVIMTTENTIDQILEPRTWTNIHALLGLATGTLLNYQNNGDVTFRAVTSTANPDRDANQFGLNVPIGGIIFQSKPMSTESLWLRVADAGKKGRVGILPTDVLPVQASGVPTDFEHELSMGRIPGMSRILKFGDRADSSGTAGTFETLWDGPAATYAPPTQARTHDIASTLAGDVGLLVSSGTITFASSALLIDSSATFISDSVAIGDAVVNDSDCSIAPIGVIAVNSETQLTIGIMIFPENGLSNGANDIGDNYRVVRATSTGAALTYVQGLLGSRLSQNEFIINNGVSNVPTLSEYLRINRMRAFAGGSLKEAVGTITATAQTDGTVTAQIVNGSNQTLMAVQSLAINERGSMKRWRANLTRKQAGASQVVLRTGLLDGVGYISRKSGLTTTGNSSWQDELGGFVLPPGVDVWMENDSDNAAIGISGGFDIYTEAI